IKNPASPLPSCGELACSIVPPLTQAAYASEGFVLSSTLPLRVSYTDVGSSVLANQHLSTGSRFFKGKMWTPSQMSQINLMFLTLINGSYNEVHVDVQRTQIVGLFSFYQTVDEFLEAVAPKSSGFFDFVTQVMYNAVRSAEFYIYKPKFNNQVRWDMADKLKEQVLNMGYDIGTDVTAIDTLTKDLMSGRIVVPQLLDELTFSEIYEGEFVRQPITPLHKQLLYHEK
ncbi:MAG: hypothetical protein WC254_07245, partial [Candidatus Woesearchaeota archaeon]